jgi:hypothetical protein
MRQRRPKVSAYVLQCQPVSLENIPWQDRDSMPHTQANKDTLVRFCRYKQRNSEGNWRVIRRIETVVAGDGL